MTVIRVHRKQRDFFSAHNEALENTELSFKAKGLWAFAMSKSDDWSFSVNHLSTVSKEKKSAIYSAIEELVEQGYCIKQQKQDTTGRWLSVDYVVFDRLSDAEEFKKCLPLTGFPLADFPLADNRTLPITEYNQILKDISPIVPKGDQIGLSRSSSKRKKQRAEKTQVATFVKVTETQNADLLKKAGSAELLQQWYDFLSKWKIGKGLEDMPNDYASINRWVISAVEKENSKPKAVDRSEEDKKIARAVAQKFQHNRDINVGKDYIEFNFGPGSYSHLKFGDHNFRDIVENNLRKMSLKL